LHVDVFSITIGLRSIINYFKIMKKIFLMAILFVGFFSFSASVEAKTISVKGYYKPSTGRYVAPSYRTSPNNYKFDNYSTKGNYNPYSGKKGTVNPYRW